MILYVGHNTGSQYCFTILLQNCWTQFYFAISISEQVFPNKFAGYSNTFNKFKVDNIDSRKNWPVTLLFTVNKHRMLFLTLWFNFSGFCSAHHFQHRQYLRRLQDKIWWLDSCHELKQAVSCQQKWNSTNTWDFRKLLKTAMVTTQFLLTNWEFQRLRNFFAKFWKDSHKVKPGNVDDCYKNFNQILKRFTYSKTWLKTNTYGTDPKCPLWRGISLRGFSINL